MKQKGSPRFAGEVGLAPILIVLLAALIVGGYLIYQKQTKPVSQPVAQPTYTSSSIPESTTSAANPALNGVGDNPVPNGTGETANWKIYTDSMNGIEFKYPSNWYAQADAGWTFNIFLDNHSFNIPKGTEFMTPIQIDFNEVMNTTTNKKFFQETTLDEGVKRTSSLYDHKSIQTNNLVISGKKAVQISGVSGPGMLEGHYFKDTLIQLDNKLLIISLNNKEFDDIYNQILSTFKFTQ